MRLTVALYATVFAVYIYAANISTLLQNIRSDDAAIRQEAVESLGVHTDKSAVSKILEALKKEIELKRETLKKEIKDKKEEFKKEVKTQKEEFKKNIEQKKSDFRGKAQEMISKGFEEAVKNIESLQTRVATRIAKDKTASKDTTLAETSFANSKTKLDAAKLKIAEVKLLIPADDTKITADTFEKVKLGARDAKDLLKEAHQELVNAVKSLKGLEENKTEDQKEDKEGEENSHKIAVFPYFISGYFS